jgi:hypothetical protein
MIVALALVLRLVVAWGSVHVSYPDEVFQYLEQAHRLVYGYGFVPWEYRFGIRNWLLPGTLAGLLALLKEIGLSEPRLYIPALGSIFAVLSLSVVYASYTVGRRLFCEHTGRIAAVFSAIWYELLYNSTLPTPEVLGGYALLVALALITAPPTRRRAALAGLLVGVSVALRLQYAIPAAALSALVLIGWGRLYVLLSAATGAAFLIFAGLIDAWSWGTPFISYWNSVVFNVVYGVSNIFGQRPVLWYVYALTLASAGLFPVAAVYGSVAWRRCWPILLIIACVLLPHSFLQHKEYRFIFLVIPLLLLLLADAIANGLPRVPLARKAWPIAIAGVILVSLLGGAYRNILKRDDRLLASLDLSRRPNVTAVVDMSGDWTSSGGFYYLHKDIPYYFAEQIEGIPAAEIGQLASHVVISVAQPIPAGFRVSRRYGDIIILEQQAPRGAYRRLQKDGREPRLPWIEDRFVPTVRARL